MSLRQGLVAEYLFHGNAADTSGRARHGLVRGATLTADRFGARESAYRFDGIDDEIVVTPPPALAPNALSVSVWACRRWIQGVLVSRYGNLKVAALYGPCIWLIMSLAVIPLLAHRPASVTIRWWVQLLGHFPFVGLPIVASLAKGAET